jgi:hypothetical protein
MHTMLGIVTDIRIFIELIPSLERAFLGNTSLNLTLVSFSSIIKYNALLHKKTKCVNRNRKKKNVKKGILNMKVQVRGIFVFNIYDYRVLK